MLTAATYWATWFPESLLAGISVVILAWKGLGYIFTAKQTLKATQRVLPLIQAEFSPNGGGSMRDKINLLGEGQAEVFRRLDHQDGRLDNIERKLPS